MTEQQRRMKQRFDTGRQARLPALTVSDWVRIHRPGRSHKLSSFWSALRQITAKLGPATFRLANGTPDGILTALGRWHRHLTLIRRPQCEC